MVSDLIQPALTSQRLRKVDQWEPNKKGFWSFPVVWTCPAAQHAWSEANRPRGSPTPISSINTDAACGHFFFQLHGIENWDYRIKVGD